MDRAKLQEMSGVKKSVFDKLVVSMCTLQQQHEVQNPNGKANTSKRPHSFIESIEIKSKGMKSLKYIN